MQNKLILKLFRRNISVLLVLVILISFCIACSSHREWEEAPTYLNGDALGVKLYVDYATLRNYSKTINVICVYECDQIISFEESSFYIKKWVDGKWCHLKKEPADGNIGDLISVLVPYADYLTIDTNKQVGKLSPGKYRIVHYFQDESKVKYEVGCEFSIKG